MQCLRVLVEFNNAYFFDFNETTGFHRLPYITKMLRQCKLSASTDRDPVVRHQAEITLQLIKQCGEHYLTASSFHEHSLESLLRIV
ncbi:hypothetical protein EON65_51800 [archaeon]|nr:MAG: hypothetical protein EON65_51800 [archaeon]